MRICVLHKSKKFSYDGKQLQNILSFPVSSFRTLRYSTTAAHTAVLSWDSGVKLSDNPVTIGPVSPTITAAAGFPHFDNSRNRMVSAA